MIWIFRLFLVDLSLELPETTQLDGFDISDDQFPEYLPSNVKLYEQDAFEEPPKKFQGQYDIVHLRLFISSIFKGKPEPVIEHCFKLLSKFDFIWYEFLGITR